MVHIKLSRFDEALATYQRALNLLPVSAAARAITAHTGMATIYIKQGEIQRGISLYQEVLSALTGEQEKAMRANILLSVAAYLLIGDHSSAESGLQEASALFEDAGDKAGVASANFAVGLLYARLERYGEAGHWLENALSTWRTLDNPVIVAEISVVLSIVTYNNENVELAIAYA